MDVAVSWMIFSSGLLVLLQVIVLLEPLLEKVKFPVVIMVRY